MRLPVHLPNQQSITIIDEGNNEAIGTALEKKRCYWNILHYSCSDIGKFVI